MSLTAFVVSKNDFHLSKLILWLVLAETSSSSCNLLLMNRCFLKTGKVLQYWPRNGIIRILISCTVCCYIKHVDSLGELVHFPYPNEFTGMHIIKHGPTSFLRGLFRAGPRVFFHVPAPRPLLLPFVQSLVPLPLPLPLPLPEPLLMVCY